jgi:hypothetical protein
MIIAGTFPRRPGRTRRSAPTDPPSNDLPPDVPGPRSGDDPSPEVDDGSPRTLGDETPQPK